MYPREWFRKEAINYARQRVEEGDSFLVIGVPGVGKSSFLKTLDRKIEQLDYAQSTIVDLNEVQRLSNETVIAYMNQCLTGRNGTDLLKFAQEIRSGKTKHVVLVDRFEKTAYRVTRDFFDLLRVAVEKSNHKLIFVLVLAREITDLFDKWDIDQFYSLVSPFTYYLKPFNKKEATEYTKLIAKKRKVLLNNVEIDRIVSLSGGHSRMINAYVAYLDLLNKDLPSEEKLSRANESDAVIYQCERILDHTTKAENNTLSRIALGLDLYDSDEFNLRHLRKLGLVTKENKIFSERLDRYLAERELNSRSRLYLDANTGEMFLDGNRIDTKLSPYEYRFLEYMYENVGQIVSREDVIEAVWGVGKDQGVSDEAIDQLVSRIREKIEEDKSNPKFLLTVRGRGFQLKKD